MTSRIFAILMIAAATCQAQPVGLGNGRDLILESSLDAGAASDAAKLTTTNQMLSVTISSPLGTLIGAPIVLACDLRQRANWAVMDVPGEPFVLGLSQQMFTLVEGPSLPAGGFTFAGPFPDLNAIGDVAVWLQAAAFDPQAPNGYAITRAVRHDPLLLETDDHLASTEFNTGTRYGYAVEAIDLVGGSEAELVVALPGADPSGVSEAGEVRILDGASLNVLTSLVSPSLQSGAWFGSSIAGGDVTGDGVVDLVVGARYEDEAGVVDAGAVYVFEGPTWSTVSRLVSPLPEATARFGHSVAVTDWTGDGIADVVVGAPRESSGGFVQAGRVHIFAGPGLLAPITIDNPTPQTWAKFGYALAAGDLDGAGGGDLVITTPFHDVNVNDDTGRAHIFLSPATVPAFAIEQAEDGFALLGSDACIADFDRDGHPDVAVSAEFDDDAVVDGGSVHVIYGPTFTTTQEIVSPAPLSSAGFGSAVAAGDVNADGYDDLVVGEFWRDINGLAQAGKGWVVFGPQFEQFRGIEAPTLGAGDRVGRRVAVGDLDGDRFADPIFGAPFASPGGQNTEGEVHVIRQ